MTESLNQLAVEPVAIHDLDAELINRLADDYNLHTVTEARDPGTFSEFRKERATERVLGILATNTAASLEHVEGYKGAGLDMGPRLAKAFNAVTAIHAEGVHAVQTVGDKIRVQARTMTFTVGSEAEAWMLSRPLQVLLRTHAKEQTHVVDTKKKEDGSQEHAVTVHNMTEHIARVLDTAITELMARSDYQNPEHRGAILPLDKRSLEYWKKNKETFPPALEARLIDADNRYQQLLDNLTATYDGHPELVPDRDENLLGPDAAPALQGMRNIFNALIKHPAVRGDSTRNEEQDPDKTARLMIEDGVDLRRDHATLAEIADGPGRSRAATMTERSLVSIKAVAENARKHKIVTAIKVAGKVATAGVDSLIELGVSLLPVTGGFIGKYREDRLEWFKRKKSAEKSARHIGSLLLAL